MTNCPICFDIINEQKNYLVTECKHKFHFSCIMKNIDCNFFTRGLNCPICRASLLPDRVSSTTTTSRVTGGGPVPRVPPPALPVPRLIPPHRPPPIIIRPTQTRNIIQSHLTHILNRIDNIQNRVQNRVQNRLQNRRIQPGRTVRSQNTSRRSILKKIDKLTYAQLKRELKKRNLSTRGYKRDTLEKRLLKDMLRN